MRPEDLIFLIFEFISMIALFLIAGLAVKIRSSKWKMAYVIPLVLAILYFGKYGFDVCLAGALTGGVIALAGMVKEEAKTRRLVSIAGALCVAVSMALCMTWPGYRAADYERDFQQAFEEMKLHYVLTEHKQIDWDQLYDKYLPMFAEADKAHDEVAAAIAWTRFAAEFHDCHVAYICANGSGTDHKLSEKVNRQLCGNDYGLALMRMENGEVVCIDVQEGSKASQAGIRIGTVVTKWDGEKIDDAIAMSDASDVCGTGFAAKENEIFYEALAVAGVGGESVTVSYIGDDGAERETELNKIGDYYDRVKVCMDKLNQGAEISNLEWMEIDGETSLLRMRFMSYDSKEDYTQMSNQLREDLLRLKEEGKSKLILDLRSNGGGSGTHVKHLLKLFAPEGDHVYAYDGVFNTQTYKYEKTDEAKNLYRTGGCDVIQGENLWGHGDIIVLVNAMTVSAGDHFTMLASAYPNVTIMGLTHSACSSQGIHSVKIGDYGVIQYSAVLLLNEDGSVFLDTDAMREATVPLDVEIPFDATAVKEIFDGNTDYVLDYAREYMVN